MQLPSNNLKMKEFLNKLTKATIWIVITSINAIWSFVKNIKEMKDFDITSILNVFLSIDWITIFLCIITYLLLRERKLDHQMIKDEKAENEEKIQTLHKICIRLTKEIVDNIEVKMIKLNYRNECLSKKENYDENTEKYLVKTYLESDTHGLTVQEMKSILDQHFPSDKSL